MAKPAWQEVFSHKASPLMRWGLGPFLLFYAAFMIIPLRTAIEDGRTVGVLGCALLILLCVAGFLATWGVPYAGRIVSGLIALAYAGYVLDQWVFHFDGDLGLTGRRSDASPRNAILGFFFWGLPCAIYTIFGRFTPRPGPKGEGAASEDARDEPD